MRERGEFMNLTPSVNRKKEAAAAIKRNDLETAVEYLQHAVAADPDDAETLNSLGEILGNLGDSTRALECFQRARKAAPTSARACRNLGTEYTRRFEYSLAVKAFKQGFDLAPKDMELAYMLAGALHRIDETHSAKSYFEKAAVDPALRSRAYYHLGLVNLALGDGLAARKSFHEALTANPANSFARAAEENLIAKSLWERKARRKAKQKRIGLHMNQTFHYALMKPLFDALSREHPVWLTADSTDLKDFHPDVVFFCDAQADNLRKRIPGAIFVDIRHGIIGKNRFGLSARMADFVCASSPYNGDALIASGVAKERIWLTGLPMMDPLFRRDIPHPPFDLNAQNKTVLFGPTFNRHFSSAPMLGMRIVELIRGNRKDISIIVKPHPHICDRHPEWMGWWRDIAKVDPDFHLIADPSVDIVPYLLAADVLVSDASSVTYEFLALDRPIILLKNPDRELDAQRFDADGIEWQWRDLGDDLNKVDELAAAVSRAIENPARHAERRQHYRDILFGELVDGRAVKRIVQHIAALP